ncbi:hypothetical protein [Burkholderia sp. Ax-1719]|uniref:hypothetical protein n=1 Tax=Burkholderia sp. Ax-1719 TaxID=2608334 RepID=UPI0014244FA2|nr:hypothetical protein [Burkholderia sp. Ax-1719]
MSATTSATATSVRHHASATPHPRNDNREDAPGCGGNPRASPAPSVCLRALALETVSTSFSTIMRKRSGKNGLKQTYRDLNNGKIYLTNILSLPFRDLDVRLMADQKKPKRIIRITRVKCILFNSSKLHDVVMTTALSQSNEM